MALDVVIAEGVGDDVVTVAADQPIVAGAALDAIVAFVAPDRVVTDVRDQCVVAAGAAQYYMQRAGVLEIIRVRAGRGRIVPQHLTCGICLELDRLIQLQNSVRSGEDIFRHVPYDGGVVHDDFGERIAFQVRQEVEAGRARQVVQAVAVLQPLHLRFEHKAEGAAQQPAERVLFLGQAAHPEVDSIKAGGRHAVRAACPCAGAVHEVAAVDRGEFEKAVAVQIGIAVDQQQSGVAFACEGGLACNGSMRAVRGDKIDQRCRVLHVGAVIRPACVGGELCIARHLVKLPARCVETRNPGVAAARDIDGGQIQRQAKQIVLQRAGDKFVDLVGDLASHTTHHFARGIARGRFTRQISQWVKECFDQADLLISCCNRICIDDVAIDVDSIDCLSQHGMAKAIDHVREFTHDRSVDVGLDAGEHVDRRHQFACELFEHQMLILHLGAETRRLEKALAIPFVSLDAVRLVRAWAQPIRDEGGIATVRNLAFDNIDQAVVLGVEDVVDRKQADVFVTAAVTGDVVGVQQFIVVG